MKQVWRFRAVGLAAALLIGLLILAGSVLPTETATLPWQMPTVTHVAAYALLGFLLLLSMRGTLRQGAFVVLGLAAFGLFIEGIQVFLPDRQALIRDAMTNLGGAVLGTAVGFAWTRWRDRV